MELVLTTHLMKFVIEHKILSKNQNGFWRGYSTVSIITEVVHKICECIEGRGQIAIIFVDFLKAFDRISYYYQLMKLCKFLGSLQLLQCLETF